MEITDPQVQAGLRVLRILADAIKELGSTPKGVMYARIMDLMPLDSFNRAIALLVASGLVKESNNVLTWIGK